MPHAFLTYKIKEKDYIFLPITSNDKDKSMLRIPQYTLINTPSTLDKKSFVDLNFFVHIEHDLFSDLLDVTKEQGQQISQEEFATINKEVGFCFSNEKFRGNRYELRVK